MESFADKESTFKILRGTWFEVQGDKWYPLEETEALSIEKKHCDSEWSTMVCVDGWGMDRMGGKRHEREGGRQKDGGGHRRVPICEEGVYICEDRVNL